MPLSTTIHNIGIILKKYGQLARVTGDIAQKKHFTNSPTLIRYLDLSSIE